MSGSSGLIHVVYTTNPQGEPEFLQAWLGDESTDLDAVTPLVQQLGFAPAGDWDVNYPARDHWKLPTDKGTVHVKRLAEQQPGGAPPQAARRRG